MKHPRQSHPHLWPANPRKLVRPTSIAVSLILAAACSYAGSAPQSYTFRAIAYLNTPAPGGGNFINDYEPTALNNLGQLAFTADVPEGEGIFLTGYRGIKQVVRSSQSAPGGGTFSFGELGSIGLNDVGDVAFGFSLDPFQFDPFVYGAIYRYSQFTQNVVPVLVPGVTLAPDGSTFIGVGFNTSLNNLGLLSFAGVINTPDGPKLGAYTSDRSGTMRTVAKHGTPVPGGALDLAAAPAVNDFGDVVFTGNRTTNASSSAVYVKLAGSSVITAVPMPADPNANGAFWPQINNRRQVAFGLNYSPFVGNTVLAEVIGYGALYLASGTSVIPVARAGDPAPAGLAGTITNVPSDILSGEMSLNNLGQIAFPIATDRGDEAMLLYDHGQSHVVAHIGTIIPGVGTIHSLEQFIQVIPPPPALGFPAPGAALNDWGQIAFAVTLEDGRGVLLLATPNLSSNENGQ